MSNTSPASGPASSPPIAPTFAALGDQRRLEMLEMLKDGSDHSIAEIAQAFPLTRQGVTRHLRILEDAGLVRSRAIGREAKFRLETAELKRAQEYLRRASDQWDEAIARLARQLED